MIERRVYKYAGIVPGATLDPDSLMDQRMLPETLVCNGDRVLAKKCDLCAIRAPYNILDWRRVELRKRLLLLDVEKYNRGGGGEDQTRSAAVEDLVRLNRRFDRLDNRTSQVAHFNKLHDRQFLK